MSGCRATIRTAATVSGVGLHLGQPCCLTFRPALPGTGRVFVRVDRPGCPRIPALAEHAVLAERRTQLGEGADALHTVEHVLSAVAALEIDDLVIEMDGPEPPVMDGSAAAFVEALTGAGRVQAPMQAPVLRLARSVRVVDGESVYEAHPSDRLQLDVTIEFPHPLIGRQQIALEPTAEAFTRELADARTFGFVHEVQALQAKGLIQGASTANAVVLDGDGLVETTLRWPDEFVRHKALDCVGDLALAGRRVAARVVAFRPSHRGTVLLVREMLRHAIEERNVYGIEDIMKVLPHRYPFLLVDRVLEIEPNRRVVGLKNVTINEPFFQGHFPGHPIMPGVLIIEAMAQVGGMLLLGSLEQPESKVVYFMSLDKVKFRRPVKPGDQLIFELDVVQIRGPVCKMHGVAKVDGEVVAEAEMAAMVRDR
ncbi:MAG TPA: bifunctional UDP-3-O-[3-hydroxymyristoyl] N-acetylglucosamine deacetylase/3-hydroxyacyl-ACP dehydratase [Gemmatimonadaceae bacterium]|nr:bifunctional UDP-3-O-[3-hydroxymyristoyl] N-acetylglucosamine deacetylase/3-hydroxyacyl-ACP dehydratase [Gemmatimonadaceae bacterium]